MKERKASSESRPRTKPRSTETGDVLNFKKFIQGRLSTLYNKANELHKGYNKHGHEHTVCVIVKGPLFDNKRWVFIAGDQGDLPFKLESMSSDYNEILKPKDLDGSRFRTLVQGAVSTRSDTIPVARRQYARNDSKEDIASAPASPPDTPPAKTEKTLQKSPKKRSRGSFYNVEESDDNESEGDSSNSDLDYDGLGDHQDDSGDDSAVLKDSDSEMRSHRRNGRGRRGEHSKKRNRGSARPATKLRRTMNAGRSLHEPVYDDPIPSQPASRKRRKIQLEPYTLGA